MGTKSWIDHKKIIFLIVVVLAIWAFLFGMLYWIDKANAHETHGWKHSKGGVGPAISGRYCSGDITQVWAIDKDGDNKVDECTMLLYTHNGLHVKPGILSDDNCYCSKYDMRKRNSNSIEE